jgi:hypothetical protein
VVPRLKKEEPIKGKQKDEELTKDKEEPVKEGKLTKEGKEEFRVFLYFILYIIYSINGHIHKIYQQHV